MNIVYLYSEMMGYQLSVIEYLAREKKIEFHIFHECGIKKKSAFKVPEIGRVTYYDRNAFSMTHKFQLISELRPSLIYVSGWMYLDDVMLCFRLRRKGYKIVVGFDDIWHNSLKQRFAKLFAPLVFQHVYSYAWVAGPYQYDYAANLGFDKKRIIFNCLSADTGVFRVNNKCSSDFEVLKFVYVGRFSKEKGVKVLLEAWQTITLQFPHIKLDLIGNGDLLNQIELPSNVEIFDFMEPVLLSRKLEEYNCAIIPSISEQWSISLHEFSLKGLPIISSDIVGAIPLFLIDSFNGFTFKSNSVNDLVKILIKFISLEDSKKLEMSKNSVLLSKRITTEIAASSLFSIIDNE
jgi:glycosyltransferase involved in cell wall biosynthesis